MEGDCVVKDLANSWSIEAPPVEITTQLLRSWLEVFQSMSAKDGLDVFVSTGRYLGHCVAFPQPMFMHFSPSFSSA